MKKLPRKLCTREHIIADLTVNNVDRHTLLCGFVVEQVMFAFRIERSDLVLWLVQPMPVT